MFTLKSDKENYSITVPTNYDEITPEVLEKLTKNINLTKNYAVIAICYGIAPFDLAQEAALTNKSKNTPNASVIVLLAKANGELPGKIGDKVLITKTDLEMGLHINGVSSISVSNIMNFIANDKVLWNKLVKDRIADKYNKFYMLEFKIVSFTTIKALISYANINDPFVIVNNE